MYLEVQLLSYRRLSSVASAHYSEKANILSGAWISWNRLFIQSIPLFCYWRSMSPHSGCIFQRDNAFDGFLCLWKEISRCSPQLCIQALKQRLHSNQAIIWRYWWTRLYKFRRRKHKSRGRRSAFAQRAEQISSILHSHALAYASVAYKLSAALKQ